MLTTIEILNTLDHCYDNDFWYFITLNHPYVYLIDSRINIFRGQFDKWAVAAEVLGYNPRGGAISLEIFYFGNCLANLELYNGKPVNSYQTFPIDDDNFYSTIDGEVLKNDAAFWIVRGVAVPLSHNKRHYTDAGIELSEDGPDEIRIEEAARLSIINHSHLFRATNEELYKSIPKDLDNILVIDEWYHKEFLLDNHFEDINKLTRLLDSYGESVKDIIRKQEEEKALRNIEEWNNNRPGSYETWQQLADVIAAGDALLYKPTLQPNSHWKNWPESGTL
ncbi:MAG TPA: hypothetical protein VGI43_00980 [Mucilaginibacter sp.]|jgi:hypothetical protein